MSKRPPISVTIISFNEESNIARAIESVRWAEDVLVVDSGSTDRTAEIAKGLGARVVHQPWPGYGQQKNYAQTQAVYDWVLNLDADEAVSTELASEIQAAVTLTPQSGIHGFSCPRRTFYLGRWIQHGGWYPNQLFRLADRRYARWSEPNVHEALQIEGTLGVLTADLLHYSFPSIQVQIETNLRLSRLGYEDLRRRGQRPSIIKVILKPLGKFLETYLLKKGFLDGLPGFIISVNAAHSMFLKYAFLFEERLSGEASEGSTVSLSGHAESSQELHNNSFEK